MSHTNATVRRLSQGSRNVLSRPRGAKGRTRSQRRLRGVESLEPRWLMHGQDILPYEDLPEGENGQVMPDFSLVDVNPTSSTYNTSVSPRHYLQKVSAYYFGYAL